MRSVVLLVAALSTSLVANIGLSLGYRGRYVLPPAAGTAPFPTCPGFGVIGSRGSGETTRSNDWDLGLGPPNLDFARDFARLVPDVQITYNPPPGYPAVGALNAVFRKGHYVASVESGRSQLLRLIQAQRARCGARTKLVLAGYSQGAELTGDAYLSAVRSHGGAAPVAGIVLFGDPLYNVDDPADVQTDQQFTQHLPLHHNGALTVHGPWHVAPPHKFPSSTVGKVLSYCLINDLICQGTGGNPFSHQHEAYPANHDPQDAAYYFAATISEPCEARKLFAAAVAKEHLPPTGYPKDQPAGAYGARCYQAWATASISRPNVGTTDGLTLFHKHGGGWIEAKLLEAGSAACSIERGGAPKAVAVVLAAGRLHSVPDGC